MATVFFKKGKVKNSAFIQFSLNRERKTLSLGSKYDASQIDRIKNAVEDIVEALQTGREAGKKKTIAAYIADMAPDLRKRFIACGLLEEPPIKTNKELWLAYLREVERKNLKDGTWVYYDAVGKRFLKHFPENGNPAAITKEDGERWKEALIDADYAPSSVANSLRGACVVFNWGIRQGVVEVNPFKGIKRPATNNPDRMVYIPMDWYYKLLDACPSQSWRTLLALCRIAGLRCPSETSILTWDKVKWDKEVIEVYSPKTGKTYDVPMFPPLKRELDRQLLEREIGRQWEATGNEDNSPVLTDLPVNISRKFEEIVKRAGLADVWKKDFQNLRVSASNDIIAKHGWKQESIWVGHSPEIAKKHYSQITDEERRKALSEDW